MAAVRNIDYYYDELGSLILYINKNALNKEHQDLRLTFNRQYRDIKGDIDPEF